MQISYQRMLKIVINCVKMPCKLNINKNKIRKNQSQNNFLGGNPSNQYM